MITKSLNNNSKTILFDIDYTFFDTAHFKSSNLLEYQIYKEVIDTFSILKKVAVLGIFSEGDEELQKKKLQMTSVEKYFNKKHIHIVKNKHDVLETLVKKYRYQSKVFLIDDKLTVLFRAKLLMPSLYCIWIKRGVHALNQEPIEGYVPDAEIKTLEEVIPIIKKA